MSVACIITIVAIVAVSVIGVLTAEEPIDELFHIEAAMQGLPLQPLVTKIGKYREKNTLPSGSARTAPLNHASS